MRHIEQFIKSVRHDIISWWEKCFISEGEKKAFTPFSSDIFTEDLLNVHENLAEKLKMLYSNNKEIFAKVLDLLMIDSISCLVNLRPFPSFIFLSRWRIGKTCGREWKTLRPEVEIPHVCSVIEAALSCSRKKNARKL